jgi:YD repeat-containing protein
MEQIINVKRFLSGKIFNVMNVKLICFFLVALINIFTFTTSYSQSQNQIPIPKVIPPSPDAAELGKYGNTPVGLHTGIPDISIPLYTVKSGNLEVPISISYHASGIKVSEIASWVGLGWSLNAGGVVSRCTVGKSDEGGFWNLAVKKATQLTESDYYYMKAIADGGDGESDYYFFNFNSRSGKFIYQQNDNINPFQIPQTPLKIRFAGAGFEIVDETGTKFIFNQIETTFLMDGSGEAINSAYYLSEILSANGKDKIQFTYEPDNGYFEGTTTYTETIGPKAVQIGEAVGIVSDHQRSTSTSSRLILPVRLKEIIFATGIVKFIKDNSRSDLPDNSRLGEIHIFPKNADGSYPIEPSKRIVFGEGYFGTGLNDYRLKLTEVIEKDALQNTIRKHTFSYNETIGLPSRDSKAQDWWGFYNGQTSNTSLIATETITVAGNQYNVGGANREPNATAMAASILNKIIYPTGGYTEFIYEPHYYAGGVVKTPQSRFAASGAMGNTSGLLSQTVTFTVSTSGWAKVNTYCSDVTDAEPFFSTVTLKKQNDTQLVLNHVYSPYLFSPYTSSLTKEFTVYLIGGNVYELTVMSKGHSTSTLFNGGAFAQATVNWTEQNTGQKIMAGGLRVKTIKDYSSTNAIPITKEYSYGAQGLGSGVLLIPTYGLNSAKREIDWIFNASWSNGAQTGCDVAKYAGTRMVITGTSPLDLTSLNGAPVVYPEAIVYESSSSAPNGKQIYKFDVEVDEFTYADKAYNNGVLQLNNGWRGGDEIWNAVHTSSNTKIKEKITNYSILTNEQTTGTKIGYKIQVEGCLPTYGYPVSTLFSFLYYFDYPIYSGIKKLSFTKEIQISSTDPLLRIENAEQYLYENLQSNHQQLTKKIMLDNEGDEITTQYWYPANYLGTTDNNNIQALLNAHIIGKPIKTESYRSNKITEGLVQKYNSYGEPLEIYQFESTTNPTHQDNQLIPSGYVKKADISYDAVNQRVNKVQLTDNISTVYLWGYNNAYPIAKVENATLSNVAATSFEFDGKGNWTFSGSVYKDIPVKTGISYYKLSGGNITKSLTAGTYKLEYWAKSPVTITGGTITPIRTSLADANGWIFYESKVTTTSTVTLTLSGSASIDELRLYPMNAQITTFTYDPIIGLTSSTDPNGITTYYDYDAFSRLKSIRDYKGNLVKLNEYHYKGN